MSPTNLLAIIVLAVAILVILVLRKRGEQRESGAGSTVTATGGLISSPDAGVRSPGTGVHAHIDTAIHTSTKLVGSMKGEDRAVLDRRLGSSGGEWTEEQKTRFSHGFERFLWEGEGLPTLLAGVSRILRLKYPAISGTPLDIEIPPDVRAVFAKLTGSSTARRSIA